MFKNVSGQDFERILKDMGFTPTLTTDGGGDPLIIFQIEGLKSAVIFYGCSNDRANSIQFRASYSATLSLDQANKWNSTKRFGKVYIDKDGDVALTLDVDLDGYEDVLIPNGFVRRVDLPDLAS